MRKKRHWSRRKLHLLLDAELRGRHIHADLQEAFGNTVPGLLRGAGTGV